MDLWLVTITSNMDRQYLCALFEISREYEGEVIDIVSSVYTIEDGYCVLHMSRLSERAANAMRIRSPQRVIAWDGAELLANPVNLDHLHNVNPNEEFDDE